MIEFFHGLELRIHITLVTILTYLTNILLPALFVNKLIHHGKYTEVLWEGIGWMSLVSVSNVFDNLLLLFPLKVLFPVYSTACPLSSLALLFPLFKILLIKLQARVEMGSDLLENRHKATEQQFSQWSWQESVSSEDKRKRTHWGWIFWVMV
jgi:hypothetical protein